MKKITLFVAIVMAVMFSACNNQKGSGEAQEQAVDTAKVEEQLDKQEVENMVEIINAISSVMDSIQIQEKMIFNMKEGTPKSQIISKLNAFQQLLADKQAEIDKLTVDNKANKNVLANLKKVIENLKAEVDAKARQIEHLRKLVEVKDANISSLKYDLRQVTQVAEDLQVENEAKEQKLNTVYYIVATKSELKAKGLLTGGFLTKKKANYANIDKSQFTQTDKRSFKLVIESKKPKLITEKPASSYTLTKNSDGTTTLQVTDDQAFWGASPFLIIQK